MPKSIPTEILMYTSRISRLNQFLSDLDTAYIQKYVSITVQGHENRYQLQPKDVQALIKSVKKDLLQEEILLNNAMLRYIDEIKGETK